MFKKEKIYVIYENKLLEVKESYDDRIYKQYKTKDKNITFGRNVDIVTMPKAIEFLLKRTEDYNILEQYVYDMKVKKRLEEIKNIYKGKNKIIVKECHDNYHGDYNVAKIILYWGKKELVLYSEREIDYKKSYKIITDKEIDDKIKLFIHDNICKND